jgi:NAD(P)-dependent dehydrogenase (short-subunit alcohol dehydrogenase family)
MATARAFAAQGARVCLVGLVGLVEDELRAGACELGDAAIWTLADVTSSVQVKTAVAWAAETFGRLTSEAGICAYATAKHALVGLMRTLAKEMAPRGIRVNTIHPGPVDNEFQHRIEIAAAGADQDRAASIFERLIPLARHASPDEVARAMLFLASDESSFVTGATLTVDGGMSI